MWKRRRPTTKYRPQVQWHFSAFHVFPRRRIFRLGSPRINASHTCLRLAELASALFRNKINFWLNQAETLEMIRIVCKFYDLLAWYFVLRRTSFLQFSLYLLTGIVQSIIFGVDCMLRHKPMFIGRFVNSAKDCNMINDSRAACVWHWLSNGNRYVDFTFNLTRHSEKSHDTHKLRNQQASNEQNAIRYQ